ncbi:MAG: acetylglutamate kinase [Clostridiaceae bacterium]|nr:acetylglutamate kinase [Clostridiaceae bacterium]
MTDFVNVYDSTISAAERAANVPVEVKASILIEALPYIRSLSGRTVVVKYGGSAMINAELRSSIMDDLTLLKLIGMNPVVVHGGGPAINEMLGKLNIKSEFVNGLRVTTQETMDVVQMVLAGKINTDIVAGLNQKGAHAIGLSGIDVSILKCTRLSEDDNGAPIDIGFVGKVEEVNTTLLKQLISDQYIPVICPIGTDGAGQSYNINADTAAAEIAAALKAEKLIVLTDVPGVTCKAEDGSQKILHVLLEEEIPGLIDSGVISGGMIPKVQGCVDTLRRGVNRAHIIDGRIPHCLLLEIFTHEGIGTMIMRERRPYHPGERI